MPAALRSRLEQTYGLGPYDSDVLVNQGRALVDYYVAVAEACGDGKAAANWVQQDVLRMLNERNIPIAQFPVSAAALAALDWHGPRRASSSTSRGREVLAEMIATRHAADEAMRRLGIAEVDDRPLVELCRTLVAANPKIVAEVQQGKLKGLGQLIGLAKKQNPNVSPNRVREICLELIGKP